MEDLANIVRRRGYKQIKELLANSIKIENEGSDLEIISTDAHGVVMDCSDVLAGHDDKVHYLAIDVPSSFEAPFWDNYLSSMNAYPVLNFCNQNSPSVEAATTNLSLCEVENIFHNGELEKCGDNGYGISNESFDQRDEGYFERENVVADNTSEVFGDEYVPSESNASLNGSLFKYPPPAGNNPSWDHHLLTGGLNRVVKNINAKADERGNQVEINHLMFLWHQKEMELSQLKEQIEKEKHALSILQTRAEKEINEVQKLISEKDAELYFAEESLSGLEEVQIQYQGDGETVEVAGSFNGWHDRVKMDPQSSSSVKPRLWTAILWLYPGIYEIKFIVDGNWRIDPQKKTVTMGGIQNNILQVGQSLSA